MSNLFDPGFDERVFGAEGVARLDEALNQSGSAKVLVAQTQRLMAKSALLGNMQELAENIEPMHRTIGSLDEEVSAAHVFFSGARIALSSLRLTTTLQQRQAFEVSVFRLPKPEPDEDPDAFVHVVAAKIMDAGQQGFEAAEAYHALFEAKIERPICPEVRYDVYARAGFGVPFYMASAVKFVHDIGEITKQADLAASETGVDAWDEAFKNMLEG